MRKSRCQAPPTSLPQPRPWLRLSRWRAGRSGGAAGRGPGAGASGTARGGPGAGGHLPLTLSLSLRGLKEGNRRRSGEREGEPGVIFHLLHLFRPARKSAPPTPALSSRVQAPGGCVPALASQTLTSSSPPAPAPTLSPDPPGSPRCPRRAPGRHRPGLSLGSRVATPRGRGGPAPRALIFGVSPGPGSRARHPAPAVPSPLPRPHPSTLITATNTLSPEPSAWWRSDSSPRVRVALTQSGQQEGLAPFLRLGPLFVAGPKQGLEPGPGERALHLPHGRGGGARGRLGRRESTDVSLKEPP